MQLSPYVLGFILASGILAQEPVTTPEVEKPVDPKAMALEAIRIFDGSTPIEFEVDVDEVAPGGGGMNGMMVINPGASNDKNFQGEIEVIRPSRDEIFLASRRRLPGFAILQRDGLEIRRVTTESEGIGLAHLSDDLLSFIDFNRLKRAVERATWTIVEPETESNSKRLKARLGERLVRQSQGGGPMAMMQARVIEVDCILVCDGQGKLAEVELRVLRSDPMAALREQALAGGMGSGGGQLELSQDDLQDLEAPGAESTYRIKLGKASSKRTKKQLAELREVADETL